MIDKIVYLLDRFFNDNPLIYAGVFCVVIIVCAFIKGYFWPAS